MSNGSKQSKPSRRAVGKSQRPPDATAPAWLPQVITLVIAWLIPGAGHIYQGRLVRGIIVFVTITALFWTGVALGGVATVDRDRERWWFIADMFAGIHGVVGWYRFRSLTQAYGQVHGAMPPPHSPDYRAKQEELEDYLAKSKLALVAPTETVARAYAGVAGLLNLMCVFDAVVLAMMGRGGEPTSKRKEDDDE